MRMAPAHKEWHDLMDKHSRLVIEAPVGHGKSTQISRLRLLWEMHQNPNIRIGVVSAAKSGVPSKFMRALREDIEKSKALRYVSPGLRKQTRGVTMWGRDGLIIERPDSSPDPTLQVFGLHGTILGSRLDFILLDDVCSMANTLTPGARDRAWDWVSGEVLSRLPPDGSGRVVGVGHKWHPQDVLARLSKLPGFVTRTYSAFVPDPETGDEVPWMPELWTIDHLKQREIELGALAGRMLRNRLPLQDDARFKQRWVDTCLQRGQGVPMVDGWNPQDAPVFTGVDLSVTGGGDLACLFTIAILPDGSRRVLDVRAGKWTGPRILDELIEVHRKFGSQITVENNAAQDYLIQFAGELTAVPMKRHTTGLNKRDLQWGVESLATEFEQGKWIIPSDPVTGAAVCPEVVAWLSEALNYSPGEHTGDRLMAAWIAREAARKAGYSHGSWSYADEADVNEYADLLQR